MVAKPSEIGGMLFPTKTERDNYIQSLLEKGARVLEGQEASVVYDLLLLHPDADKKVGTGLKYIKVKKALKGEYNCFWVVREDGSEVDFSYKKCNDNFDRLIKGRRQSAYREAVQQQIIDYRFVERKNNQSCEICGLQQDIHVDHKYPFLNLVNDFEKDKFDIPTEFEDAEGAIYSKKFRECDSAYREAWQRYHQKYAVLRLLCKKHNLSRDRKDKNEN